MNKKKFAAYVVWATGACLLIAVGAERLVAGHLGLMGLLVLSLLMGKRYKSKISVKENALGFLLLAVIVGLAIFFAYFYEIDEANGRRLLHNPYTAGILWVFYIWAALRDLRRPTETGNAIET